MIECNGLGIGSKGGNFMGIYTGNLSEGKTKGMGMLRIFGAERFCWLVMVGWWWSWAKVKDLVA